jgi:predicted polyphosphate/ATP-dependent NAD kinase
MQPFRLGLIINPIAGMGGSVGLKGTDGEGTIELAIQKGAKPQSINRVRQALSVLLDYSAKIEVVTVGGDMGENLAKELCFTTEVIHHPSYPTTAADTLEAVRLMKSAQLDLLLFAGGDGTARNICASLDGNIPVIGVPAGVKIHSGVYALTPKAAGRVVELLVNDQLVTLGEADVMDIDEEKFRQGKVIAKRYGAMQVPSELQYVQATKVGGKESDELVLMDIAADVIEQMDDEIFVMGSGSTVDFVMQELGIDNTLLGVDVIHQQALLAADVSAKQLLQLSDAKPTKLVITLIGGQGHIIGRGNQQISAEFLKRLGKENIIVIATKSKLQALEGRPMIVDSGNEEVNRLLTGKIKVTTGYHDYVLYSVTSPE